MNLADLFDNQEFDPATHESQDDFPVCPPGKYPVLIDKAEVRQNRKKTGHLISLEMTILDGPHKGRKLFDNINIQNPNPQCVEIGLKELSSLVKAIGFVGEEWKNTDLYRNKIVIAHVKVKNEQNEVRTYSSASQSTALVTTPTAVQEKKGIDVNLNGKPAPQSQQETIAPVVGKRPWDEVPF